MIRVLPFLLLACAPTKDEEEIPPLADRFEIPESVGVPESVAFHAGRRVFYVGSLESGTVNRIGPDGVVSTVFTPDAPWMTLGVKVHPDTGDVWVCAVKDAGTEDAASEVWIFDEAEDRLAIPLGDGTRPHNCNDIAFDGDRAYLTDREAGLVLTVTADDARGDIFVEDPRLEPGTIGWNGIVVTPNRELLIGQYAAPTLVRIPIDAPSEMSAVSLSGDLPTLPNGFDGAMWDGDTLVIAGNTEVFEVTSTDGWATAVVAADGLDEGIAAVTLAEGARYGLKGEVVPWVLGLEPELPFALYKLP